jgi:hypothetical protein
MANTVIVIPTYNPNQLNYDIIKSYESLDRNFFDIVVVDNNSYVTEYIDKIKELDFIKYEFSEFNGGYETGALYQVYRKSDYDNYFLVQDSIQIKSFRFFETYSFYYSETVLAFIPIINRHERFDWGPNNQFFNKDIDDVLKLSPKFDGIMCNAFGIKKYLLKRIFDSILFSEKVIPQHKFDSMAWEGCWGVYFQCFNIPVKFLNPIESWECKYFKKILQNRQ